MGALCRSSTVFVALFILQVWADTRCRQRNGNCQDTEFSCPGGYRSNLCSGGANRRCCLPSAGDQQCISKGATCQPTSQSCSGSFQSGLCAGPANRKCCVPKDNVSGNRLTNSEALKILREKGITWSASGNCNTQNNGKCTSFTGMLRATLNGLVAFKRRLPSGCDINITGGTEIGHAGGKFSHGNGYKVDISLRSCVLSFIQSNFKSVGKRGKYLQWKDSQNNSYVLEADKNHWDITYY